MSGNSALPHPVILLVEDEPLVRITAADILEGQGFKVIEAANAELALDVLNDRDDIQVLFTDVQMPGPMDGLELAYLVHDRWPHISIVIASGRFRPDGTGLPERAVFIAKPYGERVVVRTIQTLLSARM